ncbi:MAG: hypothetical protein NWE76_05670, partial [Candidatus Bathyarchaeota archaeon]|nr:hypothetical protein [Candidatus Bathyarchaeota archaeon]
MPADVNKSVEISLRANLKQLQDSLAQIPGMTKKEAQAMTRSLASEFNKAQKAAKKAADESKKAARQTTKEYQRSSKQVQQSFRDQANQARKSAKDMQKSFGLASQSIRNTRRQTRDFGAAMGSLEDVVGFINPELAAMASGVGAVGQAARSMSRSLATGNAVLIGIVATLAIAAAAYTLFTHRQAKAREQFEKFKSGLAEGSKELKKLADEITGFSKQIETGFSMGSADLDKERLKLKRELQLATGQISQKEFEILGITDKQNHFRKDLIAQSDSLIEAENERFKLAKEQVKNLKEQRAEMWRVRDALAEGTKERVEIDKMISDNIDQEAVLVKIIDNHSKTLKDITKEYITSLDLSKELSKEEIKVVEAKHRQQQIADAAARAEERRAKIIGITSGLTDQINALEQQNLNMSIAMLSESEQITAAADARRKALDEQLALMDAQVIQLEATAKTEEEMLGVELAREEIERASVVIAKQKQLITEKENKDLEAINEKLTKQKTKQEGLTEIAKVRASLERTQLLSMLDALPITEQQFANETKLALKKQDTIDKINQATEAALRQAKTQEEIDAVEHDRKRAMMAAEMTHELELAKIREAAEEKRQAQIIAGTTSILQSLSTVTTASLEVLQKSGNKNKKLITALFMAQKVAAIGEIAMNTAKSITAAPAQFGLLAPAAIAGYIATAAAQTAIVMSQQPPKFHMGGMIERTPDESTIIVKRGEAVLDRATVNRLGGEQGVNRIQNGQVMSPQVVVMNPYKHYDRFMSDRQRMGLSNH